MSTALAEKVRPRLWTPEDLAEYLGVKVGWVYKHCRKNSLDRIPHIKLGKYLRFDPESQAFQRWLSQHESHLTQTGNSFYDKRLV